MQGLTVALVRLRYRFLEHVTDALIEAYGADFDEAFDNAGRALVDTLVHIDTIDDTLVQELAVEGETLRHLLLNWLEAILVKVNLENRVFRAFAPHIARTRQGYRLSATARGEGLVPEKHKPKVEVKAPTYHLMSVTRGPHGVTLRFLLDL